MFQPRLLAIAVLAAGLVGGPILATTDGSHASTAAAAVPIASGSSGPGPMTTIAEQRLEAAAVASATARVAHAPAPKPVAAATTTTTPPAPATTTTTAPAATTTTTPATAPATTSTTTAAAAAAAAASGYGCEDALAYLSAHAAPGFTFECPGWADGHQAMTCVNIAGLCGGTKLIAINVPCRAAYMNEASNSWVALGESSAPIDPYGYCTT